MAKDKKAAPRPARGKLAGKPKPTAAKRRKAMPIATVKAIIRKVMGELRQRTAAREDGLDRLIRALQATGAKVRRKKAG